ncbi:TPA: hypothetical protein I7730_01360 [Vibrio vulnificus]|uniref:Uncharacterized protein n=1 Tax=Vibrio vulnificus TaxID=672 RepID=A0A8H9K5F1_VIBVL|nr:hypothetical protein [Vibrio vulnificus]
MLSLFKEISFEEFKITTIVLLFFVASFGTMVILKLEERCDDKHLTLGFLISAINLVGLTGSLGFVAFDNAGSLEMIDASDVALTTKVAMLCSFWSFGLFFVCQSLSAGGKLLDITGVYRKVFNKHGLGSILWHVNALIVVILYFFGVEAMVSQYNLEYPEVKNLVLMIVNVIGAPFIAFTCFAAFIPRFSRLNVQCINLVSSVFAFGTFVPSISYVAPVISVVISFSIMISIVLSAIGVKYVMGQDGE